MNEGYIQIKIRELDEQLKQMENEAKRLELLLQRVDKKIDGYDIVMGKMEVIERFQTDMSNLYSENNKQFLKQVSENMEVILKEFAHRLMEKRLKEFTEIAEEATRATNLMNTCEEKINFQRNKINEILAYNSILVNKLIKRDILTADEANKLWLLAKRELKQFYNGDLPKCRTLKIRRESE